MRIPDAPTPSFPDALIASADLALRTLSGGSRAGRPMPRTAQSAQSARPELSAESPVDSPLPPDLRRESGALMRVNHVGEVCAQALYAAQALVARDAAVRAQMAAAGREETDHLAWTAQRLAELGDRPSLLNPLWYAGAFSIGLVAGAAGDRVSLGFLAETERQVEAHLASHLDRLPADDSASRAIVTQMREDEARHARDAEAAGAMPLPTPVRWLMRAAAKLMTSTAHRI